MRLLLILLMITFSGCTLYKQLSDNEKQPTTIALLITNENYGRNRNLSTISGGLKELKSVLSRIGTKVLPIQKNITYQGLKKAFTELNASITDRNNTNLYIYFSGHGVSDDKLSKHYIEMIGEKDHYVSLNVLYDFIDQMNVRATIISLDTCRDIHQNLPDTTIEGESKIKPLNTYVDFATRNTYEANNINGLELSFYLTVP